MKSLLYPLYAAASWAMTIFAIILSPLIALFVDAQGNLPKYLSWFQTPDAPCWGAPFWKQKNSTYSTYALCVTWLTTQAAHNLVDSIGKRRYRFGSLTH